MMTDLALLPNKVNWASLVRDLLMSLGFYEVWLNQGVGNYDVFIAIFKQRLTDTFIQGWQERLRISTRAVFYNCIASFQFQPYLENVNILKYSQAISKLRMSSHRLEIESGRWVRPNSIPLNERICLVCGILEDEYHFVLECKMYQNLRKKFISSYFWKRPNMFKFVELIQSRNVNQMRKLSAFIYQAFKYRTDVLYRN